MTKIVVSRDDVEELRDDCIEVLHAADAGDTETVRRLAIRLLSRTNIVLFDDEEDED